MAGRTAQRIKIDTFLFETRVLSDISAVTTGTGFGLGFLIAHLVGFSMQRVTVRTIDGGPVMCTTNEYNL